MSRLHEALQRARRHDETQPYVPTANPASGEDALTQFVEGGRRPTFRQTSWKSLVIHTGLRRRNPFTHERNSARTLS